MNTIKPFYFLSELCCNVLQGYSALQSPVELLRQDVPLAQDDQASLSGGFSNTQGLLGAGPVGMSNPAAEWVSSLPQGYLLATQTDWACKNIPLCTIPVEG